MHKKLTLQGSDRLEAIKYGLEPELNSRNHGSFFPSRILDSVREGSGVVAFSGINLRHEFPGDISNMNTYFGQPFLIRIEKVNGKEMFVIYPFNAQPGTTYRNRFVYDLSKWNVGVRKNLADSPELYLAKDGQFIFLDTIVMNVEAGINHHGTAILPRIPAGEIHRGYLNQLAEMQGLVLGDYEEREYGLWTMAHQKARGVNGKELEIQVPVRRGESAYHPKEVRLKVGRPDEGLITKLYSMGGISPHEIREAHVTFGFRDSFYQTATLEMAVNAITSSK